MTKKIRKAAASLFVFNGYGCEGKLVSVRDRRHAVSPYYMLIYYVQLSRKSQTLYLWEEGNAPAVTEYTESNGNYLIILIFVLIL